MRKKKNKLNSALEKAAKVIEKHFVDPAPTVDDAKSILRDLRRLATKTSRSTKRGKKARIRGKTGRRSKRK